MVGNSASKSRLLLHLTNTLEQKGLNFCDSGIYIVSQNLSLKILRESVKFCKTWNLFAQRKVPEKLRNQHKKSERSELFVLVSQLFPIWWNVSSAKPPPIVFPNTTDNQVPKSLPAQSNPYAIAIQCGHFITTKKKILIQHPNLFPLHQQCIAITTNTPVIIAFTKSIQLTSGNMTSKGISQCANNAPNAFNANIQGARPTLKASLRTRKLPIFPV